ncbi:MAG: Crp/Fnr family transcriptional regulator [Rickettsiales bacterium]
MFMTWENSRLFYGIDSNSKNELGAIIRKKSFKKDEALFYYEDNGAAVYILESGRIKLSKETSDGVESIIFIAGSGDVIGENLLFGESQYNYNATALSDAEVYVISLPELKMVMKSSEIISNNAAGVLMERNSRLQKELEHIKVQSAQQRIGCFILSNCKTSHGKAGFELPYEKGVIAAKLGMKPETFSRALAELKNQGVKVEGKEVVVESVEKLSTYTCAACSNSFPCHDVA